MPLDAAPTLTLLSDPNKPLLLGSSPMPYGSGCPGHCKKRSVLPCGYHRIPLHDITAISRAIEDWIDNQRDQKIGVSFPPLDLLCRWSREHGEPLVYVVYLVTRMMRRPSMPPQEEREPVHHLLAPQENLLNSVDKVKKDLQAPRAKKEERDRKVRTLMSMR